MTKTELRREARARLSVLTSLEREQAGREIARRVWTLPEIDAAKTLLLYASLPEEVPTDAVAREAWRRGIVVVYPRCLPRTRELTLHRVEGEGKLRADGEYGIREPDAACPEVEPAGIDVALVPGLAWDRAGGRLGRGAGYYDRLLATPGWRAFRCGLFFAVQEAERIPTDPWDAPLDVVVTEREVARTRNAERGTRN